MEKTSPWEALPTESERDRDRARDRALTIICMGAASARLVEPLCQNLPDGVRVLPLTHKNPIIDPVTGKMTAPIGLYVFVLQMDDAQEVEAALRWGKEAQNTRKPSLCLAVFPPASSPTSDPVSPNRFLAHWTALQRRMDVLLPLTDAAEQERQGQRQPDTLHSVQHALREMMLDEDRSEWRDTVMLSGDAEWLSAEASGENRGTRVAQLILEQSARATPDKEIFLIQCAKKSHALRINTDIFRGLQGKIKAFDHAIRQTWQMHFDENMGDTVRLSLWRFWDKTQSQRDH